MQFGAGAALRLYAGAVIDASGGDGEGRTGNGDDGGGGGSGGAILLSGRTGSSCPATATLDVHGGQGGTGDDDGGGGGSGGRVLYYGFTGGCTLEVDGGAGGGSGNGGSELNGSSGPNGTSSSTNPDTDGDGSTYSTDCDDGDDTIEPLATEFVGDGIDQDCDRSELCYLDADNDGARVTTTALSSDLDCDDPNEGVTDDAIDCNDALSAIRPGVEEIAGDQIDQNCDTDELCFDDFDNDGFRLATTFTSGDTDCADAGEAVTGDPIDCDDGQATIRPGAVEVVADGVDQDCDTDELCYTDADNDGARLDTTVVSSDLDCNDANEGVTGDATDCDDDRADTNPAATELPGDGVDQDCDGVEDCFTDADDDGAHTTVVRAGGSNDDGDCDDANEGRDSEPVDCDDTDAEVNVVDDDGDGWSTCEDDCDDTDETIRPDATELACNDLDDDCDPDTLDCPESADTGGPATDKVLATDPGCDCAHSPPSPAWTAVVGLLWLVRRRRVSPRPLEAVTHT